MFSQLAAAYMTPTNILIPKTIFLPSFHFHLPTGLVLRCAFFVFHPFHQTIVSGCCLDAARCSVLTFIVLLYKWLYNAMAQNNCFVKGSHKYDINLSSDLKGLISVLVKCNMIQWASDVNKSDITCHPTLFWIMLCKQTEQAVKIHFSINFNSDYIWLLSIT